jgi:hypothetical protein
MTLFSCTSGGARVECMCCQAHLLRLGTEDDRDWVMKHGARSIPEIEKATLRIVALNMTNNSHQAAKVLRMAQVSLSRWLGRRMPRRSARLG